MCTTIIKCVLSLINGLFTAIAVALIVGGIILAFFPDTYIGPAYKAIKKEAEKDGFIVPENAKDLKNIPLVHKIGIALLGFGIFLFILSFLGWCGSCCACCCKWMLIVFAFIMVLLMIAEVIVGCLFYVTNSPLHTSLRSELKKKIENDYRSDGKDSFSMSINLVNQYFKCCGIDNIGDFDPMDRPKSCEAENEDKGCYNKLTDLIKKHIKWAGLALAGVLLIQLLEVIFAIIVYKYDSKLMPI